MWLFLSLLSPALYGTTSYLDKYLIQRYCKNSGVGALVIISGLIGAVIAPFILILVPSVLAISVYHALVLVLAGALFVIALIPYYHALFTEDTSLVIPIFQTTPVFTYIFGIFFLGEFLTLPQLLSATVVILGSIGITIDFGSKIKIKTKALLLMLLSASIFGLNFTLLKYVLVEEGFWVSKFWESIGFVIVGVACFMFIKPYRDEFKNMMSNNRSLVITLNGANELITSAATALLNYASLLAPLAITVVITSSGQSVFVFLYGLILTLLFPKIIKEDVRPRTIIQKIIFIIIMSVGAYYLQVY